MKSAEQIRNDFFEFFKNRDHKFIRSAPVVPYDDVTLLFTNAGMNQFKNIFLNLEQPTVPRAYNSQKVIRVSGKHNDLEEVGKDTYHHTFFEMLGSWSFGDYYKKEAIRWAWELFTDVWGIPKDKLYATVYKSDDEAFELWQSETDIPRDHVLRFGKKDNFWEMGETGPCGPCSELHIDVGGLGEIHGSDPDRGVNTDNPRFMELWNLVFIQNNRDVDGKLTELPAKHVDTGAGFERIVAYLQGKSSNYETDLFVPIIEHIAKLSGVPYQPDNGAAHRVIADHIRMLTFSITDGALPANDGRGYVLRRILRRAARFGRTLGVNEAFMHKLVPTVVDIMGDTFPELKERTDYVARVIQSEEESFSKTLDRGIEIFQNLVDETRTKKSDSLPGEAVFKLYDTYGFPADLTRLMAEEEGLTVDMNDFEKRMDQQRTKARSAHQFKHQQTTSGDWTDVTIGEHSRFIGYEKTESMVHIRHYQMHNDKMVVVLDETPFYAESGGQIGDTGVIRNDALELKVTDTQKDGDRILHYVEISRGDIEQINDEPLLAQVDAERRQAIKRNHSATHLLHAALRKTLGDHVKQAGSLVADTHLRFDFNHYEKVSDKELRQIEALVNEEIRRNARTSVALKSFDEAQQAGALAFFGEKYGDEVRTIKFGDFSFELCGGTHVDATGDIGSFRITSESAIAAGVRRIEAVTGAGAEALNRRDRDVVQELRQLLNCEVTELPQRVALLANEKHELEKQVKVLQFHQTAASLDDLITSAETVADFKVVAAVIQVSGMDELKDAGSALVERLGSGVGVLGAVMDGAPYVVCVVSQDLTAKYKLKAGDIVRKLGQQLGGGGGGKPNLATAGGKKPEKLETVIAGVKSLVEQEVQ
ncbi:MAG: alanine--tRNA ligase [Candidatus Marinimicrobia bacterium]|nr:alanine--tRNA ligase [Candidatus Neomarinimicrobiota bacterium]MCF7840406.1 alanine--tRNA ligase [Candidatus Neomarinimicrobiota bacterium]